MSIDRKDILKRRQKGKAIFPGWKSAIERASETRVDPIDFLDLSETERLRALFYDRVRDGNCEHLFVTKEGFNDLVCQLRSIADRYEGYVVVFHSQDTFIGALKLKSKVVFGNVEAIWSVAAEDFSVSTCDLENGLCLETNYYDQSGSYVADGLYELTSWGKFRLKSV